MKLIGPFSQLLPMTGLKLRGPLKDSGLTVLKDTGVLQDQGKVLKIGPYGELLDKARAEKAEIMHLEGTLTALPGFIDSHTHICFGGSRARDYALRNSGSTYLEIAKAGGGIWDTVTQTRLASQKTLKEGIAQRANRHLQQGVTTIEVKSGYGLSMVEELKMLHAIKEADKDSKASLIPTCLAAHMLPRDFTGTASEYLQELASALLPAIREQKLCTRVDAFVEESAFAPEEIAPYFKEAQRLGFEITVHADQFSTGGSKVAVAFGARSADHLEASGPGEIELLAKSKVIATALPGASMGLGCGFTPARALLDAGAALAIASDWNPGSAPMGKLLLQAAVFAAFEKLSNAEVLAGITFRAAAALGLEDRGTLENGKWADLAVFPTADYREILYQQGSLQPELVFKAGECVYQGGTSIEKK